MAKESPSSSSNYCHDILEFLLRQPIPQGTLNKIIFHLPIAGPLPRRLLKTLHLRRLAALPISEQALLSLELIHSHNLSDGAYDRHPSLLPLVQSAYLHAAVGSTLSPLADGDPPEFCDAVRRIWRLRVGDLARSGSKGLASSELMLWRMKMEDVAEVGGSKDRDGLLMGWTVETGLQAVKEYLAMEMEVMGKTALEMEAEKLLERCGVVGEEKGKDEADDCVVIEGGGNLGGAGKNSDANVVDDASLKGVDNVISSGTNPFT